jgi:hypothetical protein
MRGGSGHRQVASGCCGKCCSLDWKPTASLQTYTSWRPLRATARPPQVPSGKINTTVPHNARVWNYFLGGKDNYAVDRAAGDEYRAIFSEIIDVARAFLARAV